MILEHFGYSMKMLHVAIFPCPPQIVDLQITTWHQNEIKRSWHRRNAHENEIATFKIVFAKVILYPNNNMNQTK